MICSNMLARKSFLILIARLSSQVLSFIGLFFITRYLGIDVYGSLAFSMALVAMFNCLSDLGFNSANVKRISEGLDLDDCVSTFAISKLVLTGLMVLASMLMVLSYEWITNRTLTDTSFQLILMFILYYALFDLASIAIYTFEARMESAKSNIIILMDPILRVPVIILVALNRLSVNDLALAYVIGAFAVFATAMLLLRQSGIKWKRPTLFRSYWVFASPLALASILTVTWINIDKVILGFFGSAVDLALYNSSASIMGILTTVGASVGIITFPLFSKYFSEGRLDLIRSNTHEAERFIGMMILPITAVIIVFPYSVATVVLGGNYHDAGGPLQIFVISTCLGLLNQAYTIQFGAINRTDIYLKLTLFSLVLNSVLLIIMVPTSILGIKLMGLNYMGAAYAGLVTTICVFILTRLLVRDLTMTNSNPRMLVQISTTTGMALVLVFIGMLFSPERWYDLVIYTLLAYAIFFGVLVMVHEFGRKDLDYLLEATNMRKLLSYVKNELRGKT